MVNNKKIDKVREVLATTPSPPQGGTPKKPRSKCEVWSRVVGYLRPTASWNEGKVSEFKDRTTFKTKGVNVTKGIEVSRGYALNTQLAHNNLNAKSTKFKEVKSNGK